MELDLAPQVQQALVKDWEPVYRSQLHYLVTWNTRARRPVLKERHAEALKSLFDNSSAYPFYYVAMVANRNSIAYNRFVYMFKARAYPTVFFDGGYLQQVGVGTTVDQTVSMYRELLINASTKRTVHPLALNTTAVGKGDAKIGITVKVTNTGDSLYVGVLKSCVTEITSRWKDAQGHPYHYGLLDIAFRRLVVLPPQKSKEFTMTWNGAMKHGNLTYADIVDSNILVISSVSHWLPHKIPADGTYVKEHYAFFVDQTDATTVSTE